EEVNIEVDLAPEEPPSAETAPLSPDSLHELVELARRSGHDEAAVCASSVLVALGMATADEGDLHSAALARPPRAELPSLAADGDRAAGHAGGPGSAQAIPLAPAAVPLRAGAGAHPARDARARGSCAGASRADRRRPGPPRSAGRYRPLPPGAVRPCLGTGP